MDQSFLSKAKIALVGSGNWGTAVARRVALNLAQNEAVEEKKIKMWVFEETVNNKNLSEIINQDHENVKYLPNVKLPDSVIACPDLVTACRDADILLFILPHAFLPRTLQTLRGNVKSSAMAVTFIKGIQLSSDGPVLLSELIQNELQLTEVAAVMGANVANDVASDAFVEATVASTNIRTAKKVAALLQCPEFQTQLSTDLSTVEMCGALKNIIALGSGTLYITTTISDSTFTSPLHVNI